MRIPVILKRRGKVTLVLTVLSAMPTGTSTILGRYEIETELGRGAMGVVYRARDPKIDRIVAIKTISMLGHEPDEEEGFRERFFQEARAAGRLSHPGIVAVFDVGEAAGTREPYIVMEYVNGQPLNRILAANNGKLPLGAALHLAQEMAETLHYAHVQGVIHRDIKPANILVTEEGRCKITDFGIAKLNQASLTLPGMTLGSPAYMAPEQLSGDGCDSRSDLFSLGVIFYTILTGHRPFQGNSAATVMFKVVNRDPVAVSAFDSELPPEIDRVVSKCIAKDPAQRYQSGLQLAQEIQDLRESYDLLHETALALAGVAKVSSIKPASGGGASPLSEISFSNSRPFPISYDAPSDDDVPRAPSSAAVHGKSGVSDRMAWCGVTGMLLVTAVLFGKLYSLQSPDLGSIEISVPHLKPPLLSKSSVELRKKTIRPALTAHLPRKTEQPLPGALSAEKPVVATTLSNLNVQIIHPFSAGDVTLWLDNVVIYTRSLHGETMKKAILFKAVKGMESDRLAVPSGAHRLHIRVRSTTSDFDQSKTIAAVLAPGGQSVLQIVCAPHSNEIQMTVK